MQSIHHVVPIAAPPTRVYEAISTTRGLAGWWTTDVSGSAQPGGVIAFGFTGEFDPEMRVTGLQPGERVTWELAGGHPNWDGSSFEYELQPSGTGTLLRFWQHYGRQLSDDDYGIYNYNWGYYLESLRLLCETGAGKPFEPEELVRATGS